MPKSKRIPVPVENELYTRLQQYSERTGITITHAVSVALNDWLDTVGAARLEAFKTPASALLNNLISMPSPTSENGPGK